jgi:type I restriction enzyme, S subunit
MSKWKEILLRDICTEISYGYTTSATNENTGVKFLRITDIVNTPFNWDSVPFCEISSKDEEKYKLYPGDIVIARTGATTGTTFTISDETKAVFASYLIRYKIDRKKASPSFIGHNLKSEYWKGYVENIIGGSAQPGANAQQFADYELLLPTLPEQERIAEVLSSLDDKIDLLHRNNKTLENLAEAIFRQWFVENVKEDWEEIKLGQLIVPKKGKNITKSEAIDGKYPVVAGGLDPSCYHNQSNTKAPVITISASGANAGFVKLYYNEVWSSDSSFIDETVTDWVYFFYVLLKLKQNQIFDKQEGSAQPHIYPSHIMDLEIHKHPKGLIEKFNQTVIPIFNKISGNITQIEQLETLRNTLLPKLMSGAVIVK